MHLDALPSSESAAAKSSVEEVNSDISAEANGSSFPGGPTIDTDAANLPLAEKVAPAEKVTTGQLGKTTTMPKVGDISSDGIVQPQNCSSNNRKHLPVPLVAGGCAVVAVVAVLGLLLGTGILKFRNTAVATFNEGESIIASSTTRFRPKDADGKFLESYSAFIVRNNEEDSSGSFDQADVYRRDMVGDEGFTIADFGKDIPSGHYDCYVDYEARDPDVGGSSLEPSPGAPSFSVDYEPDNPDAADEVVVEHPQDDVDNESNDKDDSGQSSQVLYKLYADKIDEYIEKYGEPWVSKDTSGTTHLGGLYFVKLSYFDEDDVPELVLGYDDPAFQGNQRDSSATLDVWAFKKNNLEKVYSGANALDHGQDITSVIPVAAIDNKAVIFSGHPSVDLEGDYAWYGMQDGSFKQVLSYTVKTDIVDADSYTLGDTHYTVDGKEVSQGEYEKAANRPTVSDYYSVRGNGPFGDSSVTFHTPNETYQMTMDTIASIQSEAQSSEDTGKQKGEKQASIVLDNEAVMANGALGGGRAASAGGFDYWFDPDGPTIMKAKAGKGKAEKVYTVSGAQTVDSRLAADGEYVYFSLPSGDLFRVGVDGVEASKIFSASETYGIEAGINQLYAYKDAVYAVTYSSDADRLTCRVYRIAKDGKSSKLVAAVDNDHAGAAGISVSNDAVYSFSGNTLKRTDLKTGQTREIFKGIGRWHSNPIICDGLLYVYELGTDGGSQGILYSMGVDGSNPREIYQSPDGVRTALTMVVDGRAYIAQSAPSGGMVSNSNSYRYGVSDVSSNPFESVHPVSLETGKEKWETIKLSEQTAAQASAYPYVIRGDDHLLVWESDRDISFGIHTEDFEGKGLEQYL